MFIRKYTCQSCGSAAPAQGEGVYIYCSSCGSYVSLDFAYMQRTGYTLEFIERGKKYTEYMAGRWEKKEALKKAGKRDAYAKMAREETLEYLRLYPEYNLKSVRESGPIQDAYLEYCEKVALEQAFNPKILAMRAKANDFGSTPVISTVAGENGAPKFVTNLDALINMVKKQMDAQRFELGLYREKGYTSLLSEQVPDEVQVKNIASVMLQANSPYMEGPQVSAYIDAFGLRDSCHWVPDTAVPALCSRCGNPLSREDGQGEIACGGCGHKIVVGSFPFTCQGCGAPLAIEPGDDYVRCPYCSTVGAVGTYDPFSYMASVKEAMDEEEKSKRRTKMGISDDDEEAGEEFEDDDFDEDEDYDDEDDDFDDEEDEDVEDDEDDDDYDDDDDDDFSDEDDDDFDDDDDDLGDDDEDE